jgi:hypothetical protein
MEHRWGIRRATILPVSFRLQSGACGVGQLLNISTSGAYLQTKVPLRVLTLLDLTAISDDLPGGTRSQAFVVRYDQNGVGLEWQQPIWLRGSFPLRSCTG